MEASFSFSTSLNKWREHLRDMNFWLDGYLNNDAYRILDEKFDRYSYVQWNVGVGPRACFQRAISSIAGERRVRNVGPFDHVIEVDMKQGPAVLRELGTEEILTIKVAEALRLLDLEEWLKKLEFDEIFYYTYGDWSISYSLVDLAESLSPQILQKLLMKRYMLVIQNLNRPIKPINISGFTEGICLPPPKWKHSFWLVSSTSQDVYERSKPVYDCVIRDFSGDDIVMLTLYSLHQVGKYISEAIGNEAEKHWHIVALQCFYYTTMLLIPHCLRVHGDGDKQSSNTTTSITSQELIHQWASQGILTFHERGVQEITREENGDYRSKLFDDSIYHVGNVILEAFEVYSLLQIPFSPSIKDDEPTYSAAHFFAYHGLISEKIISDEIYDGNHPGLKRMQWISLLDDQGWHVSSRDWLSKGTSGPTSLIIRNLSQQSRLFSNIDNLLFKLSFLHVLDLSYSPIKLLPPSISCLHRLQLLYISSTPLESLPPSISCLQNLQLISLRSCYNLKSPFSFHKNEITSFEENNLLYLDMSYSNIKSFHYNFFHNMPALHVLLLVDCSYLEELPPSIVALSNLTTLEISGTQIRSFDGEIFKEMKKFHSLKLIGNKKLFSLPGCTDMTLEGHPSLRSFTLIDSPHIKRLSLRGCGNLESVDLKELGGLEKLDMSLTAIKDVQVDVPNLPQLRELILLGVPFVRRFPWNKMQRIPDVFYLNQCSDWKKGIDPQVAQVCISDSRLFLSFIESTRNLVRGGHPLKSFYVQITPCKERTRKLVQNEDDTVSTKKIQVAVSAYADVNHWYLAEGVSMVPLEAAPPFRETKRHVVISAVDRYPNGLINLLEVTKSITMKDDTHVLCLNDLSELNELEECMLRRCHRMVRIFKSVYFLGSTLKNACVSHLKVLTHFYKSSMGYTDDFYALKHLRLEHCPRLEYIMPRSSGMPNLVTLDVLFCYNLKELFYSSSSEDDSSSYYYQLPCLQRIRLQELPQLLHFDCDNAILTASEWDELYVRGCWSLRRLPRLHQQQHKAVKVSGERAWWANLRWDDNHQPRHRDSYEPRLPPAAASIREHVVIKTYLR